MDRFLKKKRTADDLRKTILDALFVRDTPVLQHPGLEPIYQDFSKIGRLECWRGRLPKSAVALQHNYITKGSSSQSIGEEGLRWASSVVYTILTEFLTLWNIWNRSRHGEDKESADKIVRERVTKRCLELDTRIQDLEKSKSFVLVSTLRGIGYERIHEHYSSEINNKDEITRCC